MQEFWTSLASLMGVWVFIQSLLRTFLPPEFNITSLKFFRRILNWSSSSYCYYDITEIDGVNTNELYNAVQLYLSTSASVTSNRLSLTRATNSTAVTTTLCTNDRLVDTYNNVPVLWEHVVSERHGQAFSWRPLPEEKRGFTLRIDKKYKSVILGQYIEHIMCIAEEIKRKNQERFLYTNSRGGSLDQRGQPWESVPFKHPSTFETLAMDPKMKETIMADLKDFAAGKSFYQNTGRAWKRGYLLHGPPGTGKSSMIAAMANFIGYDIYDLELTEVHTNSELRKLLMKTTSKSIIVIEDIDCSVNLSNRKKAKQNGILPVRGFGPFGSGGGGGGGDDSITLSGLLNFTDGLWSCCGSERIFVFTTNHVEKLDPALLRCGRMDMHIFMSYCSFPALKILLKNYLGFNGDDDDLVLKELEEVVDEAMMTPADVSEVLIKNRGDQKKAVGELLEALKVNAERNRRNGKRMRVSDISGDEGEEQVKKALESPNLEVGGDVVDEGFEKDGNVD